MLLLHLMQVSVGALLYRGRIGSDFNTASCLSTTTYATIGYGDVVPPPEWRLAVVTPGAERGTHAGPVERPGLRRGHAVAPGHELDRPQSRQ